jgi:transcriptional regulator with XRE-family HTH domain
VSEEEPRVDRVHALRRERALRGWSQQHVADAIEAPDASYVSRWERGVVSPSPYYQERLCRLFGRNAEELGLLDLPAEEAAPTGEQETQPDPAAAAAEPAPAAPPPHAATGRRPRRRRWALALAAGLTASAAVSVVVVVLRHGLAPPPPPATGSSTPTLYGCQSGWYCFYPATGFGGRRVSFRDCGGRQSLEDYGFGMQASSWVNTTPHTVFVYDAAGTLLWKEEPRSASADVGASRRARAVAFDTVC